MDEKAKNEEKKDKEMKVEEEPEEFNLDDPEFNWEELERLEE